MQRSGTGVGIVVVMLVVGIFVLWSLGTWVLWLRDRWDQRRNNPPSN
jgi:hypothetical protein